MPCSAGLTFSASSNMWLVGSAVQRVTIEAGAALKFFGSHKVFFGL